MHQQSLQLICLVSVQSIFEQGCIAAAHSPSHCACTLQWTGTCPSSKLPHSAAFPSVNLDPPFNRWFVDPHESACGPLTHYITYATYGWIKMNIKIVFLDHQPYVTLFYNISVTHPQCYITNSNDTPRKMTEAEIDMQKGHNHCRGSGKYDRWAACGRGISLIPLRLGAVIPINCRKIDAESLAKCAI